MFVILQTDVFFPTGKMEHCNKKVNPDMACLIAITIYYFLAHKYVIDT